MQLVNFSPITLQGGLSIEFWNINSRCIYIFDNVSSIKTRLMHINMQILQTLRVKIYTNRFQELYHCCIRLQVFSTLHQSNSGLWESLNIMQLQAMAVLALNFRFLLDFDNSKIGVQFGNKFSLCKVSIALQTIYSRYVYVLQLFTINVTL